MRSTNQKRYLEGGMLERCNHADDVTTATPSGSPQFARIRTEQHHF